MAILNVIQKTEEEQQAVDYIEDGREAIPVPPTPTPAATGGTRSHGNS